MTNVPEANVSRRKFPRWLLITLMAIFIPGLLITGGMLYWKYVLHYFATVTPHVMYKSSAMDANQLADVVASNQIKTVIDLRSLDHEIDPNFCTPEQLHDAKAALDKVGANFINLPTGQIPTQQTVDSFLAIMAKPENLPVMIHCHHGVGRTELFVALYRIEFEGYSNDDARRGARLVPAYSSFAVTKPKGAWLMAYQPQHRPLKNESTK